MDQHLIEAVRNGEEWAFKQLIKQNQTSVYNVCLSMLKNSEDAEDLAQEVFIEFYENVADFRGDSSLKTWLYRVAVNKSLEQIRRQKRSKRWAGVKAIFLGSEEVHHPVDFTHPGVVLENKEEATLLFQHIDLLTEKQRVAFTLHKIEGMAYLKVAEVMELSVSSVESLLFRANANLRKSLGDYYQSTKAR